MAFQLTLTYKNPEGSKDYVLVDDEPITLATTAGPIQATFADTPDSYTLTLEEGGAVEPLGPKMDDDYQLYVDHANTQSTIDQAFLADGPHTIALIASGSTLKVLLNTLPANGLKTDRAHLSLTDA